jgi:hypothetical protein
VAVLKLTQGMAASMENSIILGAPNAVHGWRFFTSSAAGACARAAAIRYRNEITCVTSY